MSVYFGDVESYKGAVLAEESHMWMDGMEEINAVVWDAETGTVKRIMVGYYGIDGTNLAGGRAIVDATPETKYAVRKMLKAKAYKAFCASVTEYKTSIHKGTNATVIRGKKIAVGTLLHVFWVGERPTYRSRSYAWMHETETVAGCHDDDGNKVWIKTEYLKSVDHLKSPNAKERKRFINAYVDREAKALGA